MNVCENSKLPSSFPVVLNKIHREAGIAIESTCFFVHLTSFLLSWLLSCLLRHFLFKKNPHWRVKLQIVNYSLNFTLRKFRYFIAFSVKCRSAHAYCFAELFLRHFSLFHFIFKFVFVQRSSLLSVSFRTPIAYHNLIILVNTVCVFYDTFCFVSHLYVA